MANPTHVQSSGGSVAATAFTVTLGTLSGTAVGDLVIAWCSAERNSVVPTITGLTGWTQIPVTANTNHTVGLYWKRLAAGELTATLTGDVGATGRRIGGGFTVWRGALDPVSNVKTPNTTSVTTFTANAMTPTVDDSVLLTLFTSVATATPFVRSISGHTAGWTERVQYAGTAAASSNPFGTIASKPLTGGSAVSQTFDSVTPSSASEYNAVSLVLAPGTANAAPTSGLSANKTTAIEPGETITFTLTDGDDVGVTTRTFRQVSGTPTVAFSGSGGNGSTRTIVAPYTNAGTTLVYGYQVSDGTLSSTEATVTLTILKASVRIVTTGGSSPVEIPLKRNVV
jgi:hypothetical protein